MDWYKITILVMSLIVVVSSPVLLVKAFRRKEKNRIFDVLLSEAVLGYLAVQTFWPNVTQHLASPVRWSLMSILFLFLANMFGLSRWLFKTPKTTGNPPAA